MHYLFSHGEREQHDPVENKYWPEDRHIKYAEECQHKCNAEGFCDRVPELELGKAANEGAELIGVASGKSRAVL